jgi:hypothetical protein
MNEISCVDGRDNDCDGLTDCEDGECFGNPACFGTDGGPPPPIDGGVPDGGMCEDRELGVAMCTDRRDNDCDATRDCSDPDCTPFGAGSECCNGIDDDADGIVDMFTCRCFDNSTCAGVGTFEQVCWTALFNVCAPRCDFLGGQSFCDMVGPGLRCVTTGPRAGQCVPAM